MSTPDRLSHQNVRSICEAWFDRHSVNSFPWVVRSTKHVEVGLARLLHEAINPKVCFCGCTESAHMFQKGTVEKGCANHLCHAFQNKIIHVGKLDLLGESLATKGIFCPVDHKTTMRIDQPFIRQFELDSQLTGYIWQAAGFCNVPPTHIHAYVNAIEVSLLPGQADTVTKCKTHGVLYDECSLEHASFRVIGPIERTQNDVDQWKEDAITLALRYRKLLSFKTKEISLVSQEGRFDNACGRCEFHEFCTMGRQARQIEPMFQQREWDVWKHVGLGGPRDPHALYVDNSILKATKACSTQALMRYGWHWTGPEQMGPLNAGTAVHLAQEIWWKGGSTGEALKAFDKFYGGEK